MRRGEIWTVAGVPDYAGKPRPALVIQDDAFSATDSLTVCIATSTDIGPASFRIRLDPSADNGLRSECFLMVDKITTVPRRKIGTRIGVVSDSVMGDVARAIIVFLDLAG